MANPGNVAGGHKANLNNPNTSEESKEHSRQVLDDLESSGEVGGGDALKNEGNVVGGHKANLKNPRTSDESKEHSKQVLDDMDASA
ncbi:conidiation protein 6 [Gloeophyllum trabeum ATCC 11539]|uniref:Conidiation protein 6 n=1 Tax=Gloeophyllum trabeum (strain ATCC 11539 / FP-39264 / Madison 617) TaxID=670483 RepID=S7QMZ2_GLOTA|nr:conidiation protein 6 [Gloeophyllum trabeum ATCC 11539]EPQ60863.1 conidiation protein 6 [Gloeophyllum trabeum ATCC 11539]